jgi:ribosomal protein S9
MALKADFELKDVSKLGQTVDVLIAVEGGGHAGQVGDRRDAGTDPLAEMLAGGRATQVFVALAGARRIRARR